MTRGFTVPEDDILPLTAEHGQLEVRGCRLLTSRLTSKKLKGTAGDLPHKKHAAHALFSKV